MELKELESLAQFDLFNKFADRHPGHSIGSKGVASKI
jgi:hypothetical protein